MSDEKLDAKELLRFAYRGGHSTWQRCRCRNCDRLREIARRLEALDDAAEKEEE